MLNHPLVLIPALGADERLWQPVVERLSAHVECRVIRGEGASIKAMADSVLEKAPEKFNLAGISMGGYVSLDVVLRGTGRVQGLALLNTSAIAAEPQRRDNSLRAIGLAESGDFEKAADIIAGAVALARPDITALAGKMVRALGVEVFKDQQRAVAERYDRRQELSAISVSTMVLVGDNDAITPPSLGHALASGISGARLVTLEDVGHFSALEDPDGVASALLGWLPRTKEA
ncbi:MULTISPECIES: alpha/beta fold hydrolase [unclassified Streptomyces]|uniref:alpha/beta fold hydrolase n=1 Tax=unclassified Streptomyces TaxID=2593676 RepID=UPI002258B6DB|nr:MULTISPECIES: alpha/beta hydrolase [unclassified Streptomyces]MCX4642018.1 alpha/beta hydrolase [Streptomyces sp. NBC_01446]MCX5085750.1 alpha/beta hydrolase [Streptomyces sp. NBC_00401]